MNFYAVTSVQSCRETSIFNTTSFNCFCSFFYFYVEFFFFNTFFPPCLLPFLLVSSENMNVHLSQIATIKLYWKQHCCAPMQLKINSQSQLLSLSLLSHSTTCDTRFQLFFSRAFYNTFVSEHKHNCAIHITTIRIILRKLNWMTQYRNVFFWCFPWKWQMCMSFKQEWNI